jgi:hypothetical protein
MMVMSTSSGGNFFVKKTAVLPSSEAKKVDVKRLSIDDEFNG